jgi:peptidyl-prolyl cis-trans isomerase NIMA-interacting 1
MRRMRSWILVLAAGQALGCGGSGALPATSASAASPTETSPTGGASSSAEGAACLEAAAAPREPPADAPVTIRVSHILVRHAELDHPDGATRSREEACLRALEARKALEGGGEWDSVAEQYSDAFDAMKGSLGSVSADQLDQDFASAAFALAPNEMSYVVETPRGFHIIFRTE